MSWPTARLRPVEQNDSEVGFVKVCLVCEHDYAPVITTSIVAIDIFRYGSLKRRCSPRPCMLFCSTSNSPTGPTGPALRFQDITAKARELRGTVCGLVRLLAE